jgi:hypothetical protein
MFHKAILAVALAIGAGAVVSADSLPSIAQLSPIPSAIEGQWFKAGDLRQPCYIQSLRGGPLLILTNERGEQSRGRLLTADRIIALDWENGLTGNVQDHVIIWRNGDRWTR